MNLGSETETVEFKKSTGEHREAMEAISAILNKHGHGTLYFGVADDGTVVGQQVSDSTVRQVAAWVADKIEPSISPSIDVLSDGGERTYVRVSFRGEMQPYSADGRYFVRIGTSNGRLSSEELSRLAAEARNRSNPWDSQPSGLRVEDVPDGIVERFVARGNASGRISEPYSGDADILARLGLAAGGILTNAAAEVFCPSFPRTRLTMGVLAGNSKVDILDLRHEDAPMLDLVDAAEYYVFSNVRRRLLITGSSSREEVPEIPRDAVREGIVNAFCHRDYASPASVEISVYTDTVEITNPGLFPAGDSPENHLSGKVTVSEPRNPLIARSLFRAGVVEQYGSGIMRIKASCDAAGVRFGYVQENGFTRLVFHRPGSSLAPAERGGLEHRPASRDSLRKAHQDLSERELVAVGIARDRGRVTVKSLASEAGVGRQTASDTLKGLARKGELVWFGSGVHDPQQFYALPEDE